MPDFRDTSACVYSALLLIILGCVAFHAKAIDPQLRLYEVKGQPYCTECKKRANECSCRCLYCDKPYRTEIPVHGASLWPANYISDANSCRCSPDNGNHCPASGFQPQRKRKSIKLQPVFKKPLVMPENQELYLGGYTEEHQVPGDVPEGVSECITAQDTMEDEIIDVPEPSSFDLFELFGSFMHEVPAYEQDKVIQVCFETLAEESTRSLQHACMANELTFTDSPQNVLESAVNPEHGSYLLTLHLQENWWPLGIVHLQEHWVAAFIPPVPDEGYSFIYLGIDFMELLQQHLAALDNVSPAMFFIQLTLPLNLAETFAAIHNNQEEEISDDSSNISESSEVDVENENTGNPSQGLLLASLSMLVASRSEVDPVDAKVLVAASMFMHNSVENDFPENFSQQTGIDSADGILSATVVSGTFIALLNFSGEAQQNFAILLINTHDDSVRIVVICNNPARHGDACSLRIVVGSRSQLEVAMKGLVANCGSCRMSLYKKKE